MLDSEIKKINGKTRLESVLVKNNLTGEETVLPLDGLLVAIGKEPQNEIFAEVTELDENGYIKADESLSLIHISRACMVLLSSSVRHEAKSLTKKSLVGDG